MKIIDISVPIQPGMIVYEGDPDVHLERVKTIAGGSSANVSRLDFGVHTGTHIDAPVHFIDGALTEVVTSRPQAGAYRLERRASDLHEERLPARYLGAE